VLVEGVLGYVPGGVPRNTGRQEAHGDAGSAAPRSRRARGQPNAHRSDARYRAGVSLGTDQEIRSVGPASNAAEIVVIRPGSSGSAASGLRCRRGVHASALKEPDRDGRCGWCHADLNAVNPSSIKKLELRTVERQLPPCAPCEICGGPQSWDPNAPLYQDHNHVTGLRRGYLCSTCNTGLGAFRDNPELLEAAAKYIRTWRGKERERY